MHRVLKGEEDEGSAEEGGERREGKGAVQNDESTKVGHSGFKF